MSIALQALAHCCAVLALCLFAGWVATLLVSHPTTYRDQINPVGRRPPDPKGSGTSEEEHQAQLDAAGETWYCACGSKVNVPRHQDPECAGWKKIDQWECPACLGITARRTRS